MSKSVIPKLQDIISSEDTDIFAKSDELKSILNQPTPEAWIKENKYANNSKYLPIGFHEILLDRIFKRWRIEVLKTATMFNAVEVTVRVHYYNPITNEWDFQDGVGAKELQTLKDSGTLKPDFSNVGTNAVSMALPIAKSEAIKDATHHIGKIFGRDLNRKDVTDYQPTYAQYTDNKTILQLIEMSESLQDLDAIKTDNPNLTLRIEVFKAWKDKRDSLL